VAGQFRRFRRNGSAPIDSFNQQRQLSRRQVHECLPKAVELRRFAALDENRRRRDLSRTIIGPTVPALSHHLVTAVLSLLPCVR
jgi:hypothetical protein